MPHKDHLSRLAIPSLYEITKEDVQHKITNQMGNFSATADLWSSCTSEPYLCLTIHYVDSTWKLRSHCLQAHYTPEDHIGESLQDALSITLQEWHIDSQKLLSITTDGASNIELACKMLGWLCLSCFGHNLDLAINNKELNSTFTM